MKIQKMPEDIVPLLNQLITKITALETRPLGTVYVSEKIVVQDPITGVETIIGDLTEYGEDRNGIKQWVNDTEPPAVPVVPIVTTNLGVFSVVWSGFFKDDAPMAPDFSHLNVYGNNGTSTKLVGVIKTQDEVAIVTSDSENMYDEVWSFWFTSVDQVGNESSAGEISPNNKLTPLVESPDIQGAIDDVYNKIQEDFEKSMTAANGKNRIWHTPEPPVADPEFPFIDGDTWFDTNDGNKIYIWKSLPAPAHWEAAVLDSSALDDKVTDLIQQAKDQSDTAIETANGKNKAWHSPTAPTGTNHNVGDIWFDTDDENKIYVWDGTKWDLSSADYEIPQSVLDDIAYAKGRSDSAYTLANGKNKRVDSINNPPANTAGYIAGDHWLRWSNLGTTGVLLQSWTVKGSSWILDSMDPTYLPKVDIGQGTFGSLNGDRLIANTVTAEKILVSATDNLIRDPNFNFPDTMWVNQTEDMGSGPEKWSTSITYAGGARSMVLTQKPLGSNQASYAATPSDYFEVVPGDSYATFSMVYSDNGTDPSATRVQQRVYFYDKSKNILSGSAGNQLAGGIEAGDWTTLQWNKVGGVSTVTVPAGAAYMKPRLTVYRTANTTPGTRKYYVGSISVMRAMDSTLITPESIQTPHIKAGAITAESGIIASLDAGKITTGQMHGKYIEAGTLLASKLAVRNNDNLVPNLTYEASDWTLSGGTTINDSALSSEGKRFNFPATAGAQAISYDVQVIPGEKIKVECTTYGTSSSQNLELCWFGKDGKGISAGNGVLIKSTTSNQKLSYVWTVPSTVFSVRFCVRVPYTAPVNTAVTGAYDFIVRKMTGTVLIEDGAVTADQIKTGTITAESGIIGSIDASKIVVGELNGKLIKSGTVMTEALVVADPNNYATIDPQRNIDVTFPTEWSTENDGTWAKTKASSQSYLFFRDRLGPIPFKTGEKFLVQFTAKATSAVTGTMRAYFYPDKGSTSGVISVSITDVSLTTAESYTSVEVTVPNITSIVGSGAWTLGFAGTSAKEISVKDVRILRMVDATVITNGAITTNKIDASAVTTEKLMTNAVTADKILAGAITASKLDVNSVDAKNIISNSITVDKLNITDFTTLAPLLSEPTAWDLQNNTTISPSGLSVTGQRIKFLNTSGSGFAYGPYTACKPDDEFFVSTKIYRDTNVTGGMYLRVYWYKANKTASTTPYTQVSGGTETSYPSGTLLSGSAKAPADAVYARFCVAVVAHTGDMGAYDMSGRRKNGGELIVDGAITTDKLSAGSITADKLVLGDTTNAYPTPFFEQGISWLTSNTGWVYSKSYNSSKGAIRYINSDQSTTYMPTLPNYGIPVTPGTDYWITAKVAVTGGSTPNVQMRVYSYDSANTNTNGVAGSSVSISSGNNSYVEVGGKYTVPADGIKIQPRVTFYTPVGAGEALYVSEVKVVRMASAELIVNGAITSDKLSSNAITGKTITGGTITGSTIIGGQFQTDADESKGILIRPNLGVVSKDTDGTSAALYNGLITCSGTDGGKASLFASSQAANLYLNTKGYSGSAGINTYGGRLSLFAPNKSDVAQAGISLTSNTYATGGATLSIGAENIDLSPRHDSTVSRPITIRAGILGDTDQLSIKAKRLELNGGDFLKQGTIILNNDSTSAYVQSDTVYNRTYSSTSNLYITSSGVIGRATSALKYKTDVQTIEPSSYEDSLLSIEHKSWFDKVELESYNRYLEWEKEHPLQPIPETMLETPTAPPPRHYGSIADEFHSAGLHQFVVYDQNGEVEGLAYDRLGSALIPIVRNQKERINRLESQVAELFKLHGN